MTKNYITRRRILQIGAGALGFFKAGSRLSRFGRLNAAVNPATPNHKALVCVFLFGGNDGGNMVIPINTTKNSYNDYFGIRGTTLGIPQNSLAQITAGSETYGLHPNLAPLQGLYQQNRLAVVANVGTLLKPTTKQSYSQGGSVPVNLFSHSDQQQQWQTVPGARTGWGGRAADVLAAINGASSFPMGVSTAGNSLFLTGANTTPASVTNGGLGLAGSDGSAAANARDAAFQQVLTFSTGVSLVQSADQLMSDGIAAGQALNAALQSGAALTTVFPQTGLGQQLQQVAQIMKVRQTLGVNRQIFFATQGGYDTHTNELAQHVSLYSELSGALAAFNQALTNDLGLQDQVATFTESDFGRTFQPDTGGGTDHAWGSNAIVMGPLTAANVYGSFPTLALNGPDDVSGRGVYIPSTSVDQYGATLASWFGVPDSALNGVFPNLTNFSTQKLGFL
jgi:uncharacterized protein (DUF1501 family)